MNDRMPSHHGVKYDPDEEYVNETLKLLYERGSVRKYQEKKIPKELIDSVLKAGIHAPTAGNLQPYSIIKIENSETNRKLGEMMGQSFIGTAPINLIFSIDYHRIKRWADLEEAPFTATSSFRHFWVGFQDTVICAQNICTAADAVGLGSVYIGSVLEIFRELKEMLKLPDHVFPVVLLCLGYPVEIPKPRKKMGINTVVHNEIYNDPEDEVLLETFNQKYLRPDGKRLEITKKRLETLYMVTEAAHDKEYADKVIARVREQGYISEVQRYFGLHYRASMMACDTLEFLKTFEDFGFGWFKEWKRKKK